MHRILYTLICSMRENTGPLGEVHNMKWCAETNRYYSETLEYGECVGLDPISASSVEDVINRPINTVIMETLPRVSNKKRPRGQSIECSICYKSSVPHSVDPRMRFVSLPCKHAFHLYCIEEWLLKHRGSCPLCRRCVDVSLETAAKSIPLCGIDSVN